MSKQQKGAERATTDGANPFEFVMGAGKQQFDTVFQVGNEAAEKAIATGKDSFAKAIANVEALATFQKDSLGAVVESTKIAAKGFEVLNGETLAFAKAQFEEGVSAAKALAGAKSLQAVMEMQASFAKSMLDAYLAQGAKVGEMTAKTAQEAYAPIGGQVQVMFESFGKPLAA